MRKKLFKKAAAVTLACAMVVTSVVLPSGQRDTVLADDAVAEDDGATLDCTGWWTAHTDGFEVTAESPLYVTFTSTMYADAADNWCAADYVGFYADDKKVNGGSYKEYFFMRSDLYGWIGEYNTNGALPEGYEYVKLQEPNWNNWQAENKAGATGYLFAERVDNNVTVIFSLNNSVSKVTYPVTEDKTYVALTGQSCTLTNIRQYSLTVKESNECENVYIVDGDEDNTISIQKKQHDLVYVPKKDADTCAATYNETGYWYCTTCSGTKKYLDYTLQTELSESSGMEATDYPEETLTGGWWADWSSGYEVADGKTLEFKLHVQGGDQVYNNFCAVFVNKATQGHVAPATVSGYAEYAVLRGDNFGWGNETVYSTVKYEGGNGEIGDEALIAAMKDADVVATVSRNGKEVVYIYYLLNDNELICSRKATFTAQNDNDDIYIFFAQDSATVTVQKMHTWDNSVLQEDIEDDTDALKVTDPTCGYGYTTANCSTCGHTLKSDYKKPVIENHSYEEAITEPGCTTGGYTTKTCSVCGHVEVSDETSATGHKFTHVQAKSATCIQPGEKEHQHCTQCEKDFAADAVETDIEAVPLKEEEIVVPATGIHTASEDSVYVNEAGETINGDDGKPLTAEGLAQWPCTEYAYLSGTCAVCGTELGERNDESKVYGSVHNYPSTPNSTTATCETVGVNTYICVEENCGRKTENTKTEAQPAFGHILTHVPSVEATAEKDGNIEYWECSRCNNYYSSENASSDTIIEDKESVKIVYHATPALIQNVGFDGSMSQTDTSYADGGISYTNVGASIVANPDDPSDKVLYLDGDGTATGTAYITSNAGALKEYDFSEGVTVSMNVRPTKQFTDWNYLFALGVFGTDGEYNYVDGTIGFIARYGDPYNGIFPADGWVQGNSVGSAYDYFLKEENADKWYNLTYVFGKDSIAIYVDGDMVVSHTGLEGLDTILKGLSSENGQLRIGGGTGAGTANAAECFTGYIDDVMVYTSTLQASDVENVVNHANGHILGDKVPATVTCTEAGNVEYYQCTVCNKYFADAEAKTELDTIMVDKLGHDYGDDVTYTDESGNELTQEQIDALKCSQKYYVTGTCKRCGNTSQGEETAGSNHTYGDAVVTTKATPEKNGVRTYTCTDCTEGTDGHTKTEVIKSASDIMIAGTSYEYTGSAITPAVTVKDSDGNEIAAANYDVAYSDNQEVGTAKVTVTFKGDTYEGSVEKTFTITAKEEDDTPGEEKNPGAGENPGAEDKPAAETPAATLTLSKTQATLYTGKASNTVTIKPTVTGASQTVTWKSSNPKVASVKNGKITALKKGTATITATANGISKTVKVTVKNPTLTLKKSGKKFTKTKLTVKKKKKVILTVTVSPKKSGISIAKLTKKQKKIATVTLKGSKITIKGKKKGSFTLKITSGKTTKKIKIKVK